jgi:predicted phage-related endonuclease
MIERREITSRDQWLEWRRQDVTASVVGALFNAHPYVTALRVFVEKRGVEFENSDNKAMRRGRWLEPAVGKAVEELRPEWKLIPANVYLRDPDLRLGATPDFFIEGDPRGLGTLQAKTVAPSVYHREWHDGEEVPLWITLQSATETMLSEATFGVVAALLVDAHNMDVSIHELPRHQSAEQKIIAAVKEFWQRVAEGREPEPDYGRDADVVRMLYPKETKGRELDVNGDNALPMLLDERVTLQSQIKACESRVDEIDTELKFKMGDAEIITGLPGWRVTFKSTDRAGYTVAPKTIRSLRVLDKREKTA